MDFNCWLCYGKSLKIIFMEKITKKAFFVGIKQEKDKQLIKTNWNQEIDFHSVEINSVHFNTVK